MHEFALADAVITAVLDEADRAGMTTVRRFEVRVGELQRIRAAFFEDAIRQTLPRSEARLAGIEIDVRLEPARFRCRPCGDEFGLADVTPPDGRREAEAIHFVPELAHAYLRCPGCASPDFELLAGRGITLGRIEGDS